MRPYRSRCPPCKRGNRWARPALKRIAGSGRSRGLGAHHHRGAVSIVGTFAASRERGARPDQGSGPEHGRVHGDAVHEPGLACARTRERGRASESVCAGVHHGGLRAAVAKSRSEPPPSELLWRRRRGGGDSEANPLRAFPSARAHARFAEVRPRFADWRRSRAKCPCGWKEPRPVGRVTRRAAVGSAPRPRPRNRRRRFGGAASCGSGEGRRSSALPPARAPTWEVRKSTQRAERSAEGGRRRFRCSCHHQRSLAMRKGMG